MTEHDDTALTAVDARLRRAGEDLRHAVDEAVEGWPIDSAAMSSRHGAGEMVGSRGETVSGDQVVAVAGQPASTRRPWLAAAALVLVAGLVATFLATRRDDRPGLATGDVDQSDIATDAGDGQGYLVPGWLPSGWEPLYTELGSEAGDRGLGGVVTVYGDTSREDPWRGPVLAVYDVVPGYLSDGEAEEITVGGQPATVDSHGDQITVAVGEDGDSVGVVGYGFVPAVGEDQARATVLTAADHLDGGSAVAAGGLPDGYEQIATGPQSATASPGGRGQADGLSFSYGSSAGEGQPGVDVWQQAIDDPQAAALLRLLAFDVADDDPAADVIDWTVDVTEVRGQPAYLLRTTDAPDESGGFAVMQWYEPELDLLVTVRGNLVDLSTIELFADGLRLAEDGEVDELLDGYGTVLARGEHDGETWGLAASDWGDLVELTFSAAGTEEVMEIEDPGPRPGGSVRSSLPLGGEDGDVAVFGTVDPAATEVLVQSPDGRSFELEIYQIDGWEVDVFLGFAPVDLAPWPDQVEIVARDADGQTLPGWPSTLGLDDF